MTTRPTVDYIDARFKEIGAACDARDGARGVAVLEQIRLDGYTEFADELLTQLVAAGLANLQAGVR